MANTARGEDVMWHTQEFSKHITATVTRCHQVRCDYARILLKRVERLGVDRKPAHIKNRR